MIDVFKEINRIFDEAAPKADIRVQARLQRSLTVTLMESVTAAVESGLNPDNAAKAVKEVSDSEQRLAEIRRTSARSYL